MLFAITFSEIYDTAVLGLINGAVYALVALGLVLVYRSSGIFNFAQAEFGTVAVYGTWFLHTNTGLPYVPAMIVGVICGALVALATERFVIRPLAEGPKVTLLVATAGTALLAIGIEFWRTGDNALKFLEPLNGETGVDVGVTISMQRIFIMVFLGVAVALLFAFFNSPYGLAILAASQDAEAAELVGVNVNRVSMMVWGLAGVLGATAGILLMGGNSFTPGAVTSAALIPGFTAAVIGGLTSLPGAVVGGLLIGTLESLGRLSTFDSIPGASSVAVFVVLLTVLLVKPDGLLGGRT